MKHIFIMLAFVAPFALTSCKVDFSPNAPWRDVPDVYCVIDPEEDTVWARVQRCYLGEDNLYNYASIADSNYYAPDAISVHLLAWKGERVNGSSIQATDRLVGRWQFQYTERNGKPEGRFPSGVMIVFFRIERMTNASAASNMSETDPVNTIILPRMQDESYKIQQVRIFIARH